MVSSVIAIINQPGADLSRQALVEERNSIALDDMFALISLNAAVAMAFSFVWHDPQIALTG